MLKKLVCILKMQVLFFILALFLLSSHSKFIQWLPKAIHPLVNIIQSLPVLLFPLKQLANRL